MNRTKIEWVKNPDGTQGYTWNPITGCLNHVDGRCKGGGFPCYAYRLANGRLKQRYLANKNLAGGYRLARGVLNKSKIPPGQDPFYPRFWPERLEQPFDARGSAGIFVCDMGELFGDWVPRAWQESVFNVIKIADRHRFYLLTKQPQNLIKFSPFPENCWVGITCTDYTKFHNAIPYLNNIEAKVKFVSLEPLLAPVHLQNHILDGWLNWVIIGAQTKPYKPPRIEWVEEIVTAADEAGILVFLKDNLRQLIRDARWPEWSMNKRADLRQEMP